MGTPEFAVASLDILVKNNFNIVGVVTSPDKPAGRGQKIQQSAVKQYAVLHGLKVLQPEKLKDENFISELKALNADIQIVVAFRMLPEIVWNMPVAGTFNLHGSLLPKYRGAAPINWAVINGDKETGVTTFKLKHEIDTGNVLFREKIKIEDTDSAGDVHDKLMTIGAELILKTVRENEKWLREKTPLPFIPQDDTKATHAPKIFRETCKIDWNKNVENIHNLIRGLSPYPAAWCYINNPEEKPLSLKIFVSGFKKHEHSFANGNLITNDNKLIVHCSGGSIEIKELQLEGKKRMPASEFLKGFKVKEGANLS